MSDTLRYDHDWADAVAQSLKRYFDAGRADFFVDGLKLISVSVDGDFFNIVVKNPYYDGLVGLVRSVHRMAAGFNPPLDPDSAAQLLAGEVALPPEAERLTWRGGVGWWGDLHPDAGNIGMNTP